MATDDRPYELPDYGLDVTMPGVRPASPQRRSGATSFSRLGAAAPVATGVNTNASAARAALPDFSNVRANVFSTEKMQGGLFDDVVGGSRTKQGEPPVVAAARRRAPQVSAEGASGFSAPGISAPDDSERKAALSNLDSALFGLGRLNMRSKRDLYGQLLGMKNDLTKTGFNAANDRALQNQRVMAQAGADNAQLREAAAKRRGDAAMFNAEIGEKRDMFETEREDAAAAARAKAEADSDPSSISNRLKLARIESLRAGTRMKAGEYDVKREDARRAQWLADNPGKTNTDFDEAFAREQAAMGFNPTDLEGSRRGDSNISNRVRDIINRDENFITETATAGFDGVFNDEKLSSLNLDDVSVGRNESLGAAIARFGSAITPFTDYDENHGYYVEAAGAGPGMNRRSKIGRAEYDELSKYLAERRRARSPQE